MNQMEKIESKIAKSAKEIVMEFLTACERKDFKSARAYLSDNVSYVGPTGMGSFDKAEPYLKYLEHLELPKSEIKKVFVDGDDVCVLHELNFDTLPAPMFVCTWYRANGGKISSIKVVFDPRPYLEEQRSR